MARNGIEMSIDIDKIKENLKESNCTCDIGTYDTTTKEDC